MRFTRPGMSEAALVAHFEYICSLGGADRLAYVPVCGTGERTQTIHYTTNNQLAPAAGLVLIDAGCEFHGYASDITRTFPVSGVFSQPQKDLYQAVLNVTRACTKLCKENNRLSMQALHNESNKLLKEELRQLGFNNLLTTLDDVYPHFLSHRAYDGLPGVWIWLMLLLCRQHWALTCMIPLALQEANSFGLVRF